MTKDKKQEFTLRIAAANPTEMVVILYDMLLQYLEDAEKAQGSDIMADLDRAVAVLKELMNSLNLRYEPAPALKNLYGYCVREISRVKAKGTTERLDNVRQVIIPLRDAYAGIANRNPFGPVMRNTEKLYTGLTYGRDTLPEVSGSWSGRRGVLA